MTVPGSHLDSILSDTAPAGAAFFDLDRTLISGYSVVALALETARYAAARGELRQAARLSRDILRQRVDPAGGNYHRLIRRLAKALSGVTESTLEELGQQACRNHLERTLYKEAVELVEAHRRRGHHLVIVSAASRYQVEPIARLLGIQDICCTRLVVENGRFTGEVVAPLCYGEGKALAARRVLRRTGIRLRDSWFYTDSSADLPLLKKVGHPVAVNPSERLGVHARNRQWPQLHFSSRGRPTLERLARTGLLAQTIAVSTGVGFVAGAMGLNPVSNANRLTQLVGDVGSGFAGLEYEVEGRERLHRERPAIYIFNHQSLLDAMVLAHLLRQDAVPLCKREMAANPLLGPLLRQVDTIFVDRNERDQREVLKNALEVLQGGRSLVIAPEGTRSTLGNIQPFKMGAFVLAKKARVPIVPIVLHNVKDALPKGGRLLRPANIRVSVLEPIPPGAIGNIRAACRDLEHRYCSVLKHSPAAALPFSAAG
jgi:putative phosphoserine phosphatase/1-acylglycerol-3-phosphate O-acyltransferase